ncbi:DUF1329 domain-containing protein [Immundisolibacter sp.]
MCTKPARALGTLALLGLITGAVAQDIAEGTVVSAANIDQVKTRTFEGKPLADLILPTQERIIREFGLQMRLRHTAAIEVDPQLAALTKQNPGKASINPQTRTLDNFSGGMPFASIDAGNPADGIKVAQNFMRGPWYAGVLDLNPMYFAMIDGQKGLDREQHWRFGRYLASNAWADPLSATDLLNDAKAADFAPDAIPRLIN